DASETKPPSSYVWAVAAVIALGAVVWLVSSLGASNQSGQVPVAGDAPSARAVDKVSAGQQSAEAGAATHVRRDAASEPGSGGSGEHAAASPKVGTSASTPTPANGTARGLGSGPHPQIPTPSGTTSAAPAKSAPGEGT